MTIKQYSDIQRCLGKLEGIGDSLPNETAAFFFDTMEVLDAIIYHTTGRPDMTTLDKIVYLADKIEPSRTYTDLTEMRRLAPDDLDVAVALCLESVMDKFRRKGRDIHPITLEWEKQIRS